MSSAEAELVALVKCTAECMGVQSMYRDWGSEKKCTLYADSSAALAIAKRKGAGKLRHINVSSLWIQDVQDSERVEFQKVLGTENPADCLTKHVDKATMVKHLETMGLHYEAGRADLAPELSS